MNVLMLDEFSACSRKAKRASAEMMLARGPGTGKSKAAKKALKRANKLRKKLGLPKLKLKKLKLPKRVKVSSIAGYLWR